MYIAPITFLNGKNFNKLKQVAFTGIDYQKGKKDFDEINKDFDEVYDRFTKTDFTSTTFEAVKEQSKIANDLEQLSMRYKILDEFLNDGVNLKANVGEKITEFLRAQSLLSSDCGFNKIIGHDDIKTKLNKEFAIDKILKSQVAENVEVPNSILFFGPTGCGKTYFATALAEQTLSNVSLIDATNALNEEDVFDEILKLAQKSKDNFDKTGKRTMIVLNESDFVLYKESPIENKFIDFVKDCSDKYKCTMFLSTNNPLDISDKILSKELTPLRVPLPNPDEKSIFMYLKQKIHKINSSVSIPKIMSYINDDKTRCYSFSSLNNLLEMAAKEDPKLGEEVILNILKSQGNSLSIRTASLNVFKDAVKILC